VSNGTEPPLPEQNAELLNQIADLRERVKGLEAGSDERERTYDERESRKISEALRPLDNRITGIETSRKNLKWAIGISVGILTVLIGLLALLVNSGII
jgi:hypothetical protein